MRLFLLLAVFFFASTFAKSPEGNRVLVVLKDASLKISHSLFFKSLQDRGFELTFGTVKDSSIVLSKYGEYYYDHLVLFVSGVDDFAPKISPSAVIDFIDAGKNVLLATDSAVGDPIRELASEVGLEVADEDTYVIDHFNAHSSDPIDHTLIVANLNKTAVPIITGNSPAPVLFRGVAHMLKNTDSYLNLPLLSGYPTSYSFVLDKPIGKKQPLVSGEKTLLVSALQARNNARFVFSGSLDLFSDKFFKMEVPLQQSKVQSGNQEFATRISSWVFKESGAIKVNSIQYYDVKTGGTLRYYTIKDDLHYSIQILEWKDDEWKPFSAKDVQLEFILLDPYVRAPLEGDKNGFFNLTFKLPDVYGVFSLVVDYKRPGFSYISTKDVIPVRPFRHNQYERFIVAALPYYASATSMLVGVFLFSFFFLYTKDTPNKGNKVKSS